MSRSVTEREGKEKDGVKREYRESPGVFRETCGREARGEAEACKEEKLIAAIFVGAVCELSVETRYNLF